MLQGNQIRAVMIAVLVVASFVGAPLVAPEVSPVGSAEAQTYTDTPTETEDTDSITAGDVACGTVGLFSFIVPDCNIKYGDFEDQIINDNVDDVHSAVYRTIVSDADARIEKKTEAVSHADQVTGLANAEAKYAIIKSLNQNETLTEAKSNAEGAVNDFYSSQQNGIIITENRHALNIKAINSTVSETDGLVISDVSGLFPKGEGVIEDTLRFNEDTVQLFNGENVNVTHVYAVDTDPDSDMIYSLTDYGVGVDSHNYPNVVGIRNYLRWFNVDGTETATSLNNDEYGYAELDKRRQFAINNSQKLAEDIYAAYQPGDVSVADAMSPEERLRKSVTDYESTGGYGYTVAVASELGYATNATSAFQIDYTPAGDNTTQTLSGSVYAQTGVFPNDTIETGVTYDTANLTGSVFFVDQLDSKSQGYTLDGTFTVTSMTNVISGESVNSTTISSNEFATTGTANLTQQINDVVDDRNEQDEVTGTTGGGSIIPDGRVIGNDVLVLGGIVLGIVFLLRREE